MSALDRWAVARAAAEASRSEDDLDKAADDYFEHCFHYPPDHFRYFGHDRRRYVSRALGDGTGWASRLIMTCPQPTLYTFKACHVGIELEHTTPDKYRDPTTVRLWAKAIDDLFAGRPYFWKLECESQIHAHVLADSSSCPSNVRLHSECAKVCDDDFEKLLGYLGKRQSFTPGHLADYWRAKRKLHRLPRTSGVKNLPRQVEATELNALRVSSADSAHYESAPTSPKTPAEPTSAPDVASHLDSRLQAAPRSRTHASGSRRVVSARKHRRVLKARSTALRTVRESTKAESQLIKHVFRSAQRGAREPP